MLIEFKEQQIADYIIPSFAVAQNEIIVLRFPNEPSAYGVITLLNSFLTGQIENNNVLIYNQFAYVPHSVNSRFFDNIFPLTVRRLINRIASNPDQIYRQINEEISWLTPDTKIETLAGDYRRLIYIYNTLSKTSNIIFDLPGLGTDNRKKIYSIVKNSVAIGGAAILYDYWDDFRNDCTTFIEIRHIGSNN